MIHLHSSSTFAATHVLVCALAAGPGCQTKSPTSSEEALRPPVVPTPTQASTIELTLTPLQPKVWLHTSTQNAGPYRGLVSHGLVVRGEHGVLLVDTAWGEQATVELLAEVERLIGQRPTAAIITDFHDNRAGGVQALHTAEIDVYSSSNIIDRIDARGFAKPLSAPVTNLSIAGTPIEVFAPGPGHSPENLVAWLPHHQLLFGGCLVRPFDSRSLGNTEDADLIGWGPTIRAVKQRYPNAEMVVPSHGSPGGTELLDHTLALIEAGRWAKAHETGETLPIRMAVTVDDLPRHGPLPENTTRLKIHEDLLAAFARHQLPHVWGFVNGARIENEDERQALERWIDAGHPIGNHSWSHLDLRTVSVSNYLDDVHRNEVTLAELTNDDPQSQERKMFRYPYLQQGTDEASTHAIREFLTTTGYTVAEVSIDFWDWDYQQPFARCRSLHSDSAVAALKRTYLRQALAELEWNKQASIDAFGRPIAHVLLLHAGAFTADMIDALLTAYEDHGVQWISLEEALADPVYRDVPVPPKTLGQTIVDQGIESFGADHPPWLPHPGALLAELCPSPPARAKHASSRRPSP